MTKIIFTGKFYCELCKKEIVMPLYGVCDLKLSSQEKTEAVDWMRHFHWTDNHRLCAICGEYVPSGKLDLIINDGKTPIHQNYTDEYLKIKRGNKFDSLLIVHTGCLSSTH